MRPPAFGSTASGRRSLHRALRLARWRRPYPAPEAEAFLAGLAITPEAMEEAGRIAATEAKPISDFRASADYRRDLIAVLVKRALATAYERATAKSKELVS